MAKVVVRFAIVKFSLAIGLEVALEITEPVEKTHPSDKEVGQPGITPMRLKRSH